MRLEHHLVGGYVRYISPHIIIIIIADIWDEDPRVKISKVDKDAKGKVNTQTVKLNNNQMTEMTNLDTTLAKVIESPEDLTWIDLSFNDFSKIDPVSASDCITLMDYKWINYQGPGWEKSSHH